MPSMYPHSYPMWWVLLLLFFVDKQTEAQREVESLEQGYTRHLKGTVRGLDPLTKGSSLACLPDTLADTLAGLSLAHPPTPIISL